MESKSGLKLVTYGQCENPDGFFVGLSRKQMRALDVELGEKVEIFAAGKSVGIFTVIFGSEHIVKDFSMCQANLSKYLDKGPVTVRKTSADRLIENGFSDQDIAVEMTNRADTSRYRDRFKKWIQGLTLQI